MRNNKGQSLIEALIALSAAVAIISAISIAVIASINNADFSKNQNLASQYAQQGMEILKEQSTSDWPTFSSYSGAYCLSSNSTTLTPQGISCTLNISNTFVRQITISQNSGNCSGAAQVIVKVSWADGKCTSNLNPYCHNVTLNSCLANIDAKQAP